jgi:hypothetical protein
LLPLLLGWLLAFLERLWGGSQDSGVGVDVECLLLVDPVIVDVEFLLLVDPVLLDVDGSHFRGHVCRNGLVPVGELSNIIDTVESTEYSLHIVEELWQCVNIHCLEGSSLVVHWLPQAPLELEDGSVEQGDVVLGLDAQKSPVEVPL